MNSKGIFMAIRELELQREAERQPLDEHLKRLHLRNFNLLHNAKLKLRK